MSENKELDAALLKLETKHRFESLLIKLGASEEAAKLIASSADQLAKVQWDGVNLHFGKSDLAAVDDPTARTHFLDGPFKSLFVAPADKADGYDNAQLDEALVASAAAGNITAKGRLLRSLNGDVEALNAALADKRNSHDKGADGHDKLYQPAECLTLGGFTNRLRSDSRWQTEWSFGLHGPGAFGAGRTLEPARSAGLPSGRRM